MKISTRTYYLANSCHVCKELHPTIPCEICHMIAYCTVEHRRENWQVHSHLCRALYKLSQNRGVKHIYEKAHGLTSANFRSLRHATAEDCMKLLDRSLEAWELELLYYPKMCGVCFAMHPIKLIPCQDCQIVYTCPKKHFINSHSRWCSTLKTYHDIIRCIDKGSTPTLPEFTLTALPQSMASALDTIYSGPDEKLVQAFTSELLTYPLTVAYALLKTNQTGRLLIHVIGAELQAEVLPLWKWETFLLHLLPNCKKVSLVFIGPDLQDYVGEFQQICNECRAVNNEIEYKIVPRTFYHQYVQQNGSSKPDLKVLLNNGIYRSAGFQGVDSWKPTLEEIFAPQSAPTLITEYTLCEINQDLKILKDRFKHIKELVPPQLNQYASTKASLNVISDDEVPVIFKNYFFMVLGTSL